MEVSGEIHASATLSQKNHRTHWVVPRAILERKKPLRLSGLEPRPSSAYCRHIYWANRTSNSIYCDVIFLSLCLQSGLSRSGFVTKFCVDRSPAWRMLHALIFFTMLPLYPASQHCFHAQSMYSGADKSLARPGRKQTTATEDFEFHISYL